MSSEEDSPTARTPNPVSKLRAADIMNRPVISAYPTTMARNVAIQMLMGGYSGVPITETTGEVIGIVSEIDIIRAIRAGKPLESTEAGHIMARNVICVDAEDFVDSVLQVLDEKKIVRVPVVREGKLAGVISRPDVLRAFIEPNFMTFS